MLDTKSKVAMGGMQTDNVDVLVMVFVIDFVMVVIVDGSDVATVDVVLMIVLKGVLVLVEDV